MRKSKMAETCPVCEGAGMIWIRRYDGGRSSEAIRPKRCSICRGTGFIGRELVKDPQPALPGIKPEPEKEVSLEQPQQEQAVIQ